MLGGGSLRLRFVGTIVSLLPAIVSCSSWEDEFKKKINMAMSDRNVTEAEFKVLSDELKLHPEGISLNGNAVKTETELAQYISSFGITGTAPALDIKEVSFDKLTIMYENSASMAGYSNSGSDRSFSESIIALWNAVDEGTEIETGYAHDDSKGNFVFEPCPEENFQSALTSGKIHTATSSPIDQILLNIASDADDTKVTALITDAIMSGTNSEIAGSKGRMWTYNNMPLLEQRVREAMQLAKNNGKAFSVYRLETSFNGTYYDFKNGKHQIKEEERPYFIMLFGPEKHLLFMDGKLAQDSKFEAENHLSSYGISQVPTVDGGFLSDSANTRGVKIDPVKMEVQFKGTVNFPVILDLDIVLPAGTPETLADEDFLKNNAKLVSLDSASGSEIDRTDMIKSVKEVDGKINAFIFSITVGQKFANEINGQGELRFTVPVSYETLYGWYKDESVDYDIETGWDEEKTFALENLLSSFFKGYGTDENAANLIDMRIILRY